jgi:hypothetical protein
MLDISQFNIWVLKATVAIGALCGERALVCKQVPIG